MKFTFALLATAVLLSSAFAATTLSGTADYDTANFYYEDVQWVNEGEFATANKGRIVGCFNDWMINGLTAKAYNQTNFDCADSFATDTNQKMPTTNVHWTANFAEKTSTHTGITKSADTRATHTGSGFILRCAPGYLYKYDGTGLTTKALCH